ncbi:hypothetical protein [Sphingobacterium sp. DR205]|uniref:hypothetical protein n=1 Tax=Sphingobacterium sp. DR205 TaxID=2713573 RepID=UPI0013E417B8|nr:hypothetical protein [Sphingobacterium sp. DR205]QIH34428.1 hypothetical protein G6053_16725 [Sphingobacterium sp. DR205]
MIRYWLTFNLENFADPPFGIKLGCGVTALSKYDALKIVEEKIFFNTAIPPISSIIGDIDVSSLDENHIIPNMSSPTMRGIWFPLGYQ